ncbi:MAG: diaminopimelate epimerase [Elusimicrobia bacterium RIFOXYB2_FULL_62_6]|nr:MAG: diaminopimelate epimerase [Elusimicrobia bacterium RIFOXYB2_FULL_62_6]
MKIEFYKMSGAGNDFVLLGGGNYTGAELKRLAVKLCDRKNAVGADGLLYVRKLPGRAVSLRYFNSDGSEAFCGNGSRCSAWWAYSSGLVKSRKFALSTIRGVLPAEIIAREKVRMRMPDVPAVALGHAGKYPPPVKKLHFLNTGVPHAVVPLKNIGAVDVDGLGRALRYNKAFGPAGTNVDFVALKGRVVHMRTYERGVEAETLACGTGATASAIAIGMEKGLKCPVAVISRSGEKFRVWFKPGPQTSATGVYIEGPAKIVFEGATAV